jgi:hypothetical protein
LVKAMHEAAAHAWIPLTANVLLRFDHYYRRDDVLTRMTG